MTDRIRHVVVHGRVQGVFYRASTVEQAQRLGIHGWVRNRRDGSVEALIRGAPTAVSGMLEWMAHGPPNAQVREITVSDSDEGVEDGFTTRSTV